MLKTNFLTLKDLEFIEYDYGDSSVPPEYHRSYKIRIEKEKISIIVDSYGEILNQKTFPLLEKDLKEILSAVKKIDFKKKFPQLQGCTGGVSKALSLKTNTSESHISIYYYGGKPSQKVTQEVDSAASIIISKVPEFEKQLKRA